MKKQLDSVCNELLALKRKNKRLASSIVNNHRNSLRRNSRKKKSDSLKVKQTSKVKLKTVKQENQLDKLIQRNEISPNKDRERAILKIAEKLNLYKPSIKLKNNFSNDFYNSREWKELRYKAIRTYGRVCMACGQTNGVMHVDHIKPRSMYPELQLDFSNLQILCADCNLGKSNKFEDDFRRNK